MLNWVLSIMVLKEIITKEEAEHLAKELAQSIYETRFNDAHATVERILRDYERKR